MSNYSDASIAMYPGSGKVSEVYSQKPTDDTGNLTFARNCVATEINSDNILKSVAINTARFNYGVGVTCPSLLLEPQSTNLITYPVTFSNAYWTKTGSSVVSGQSSPHVDYPTGAFKLLEDTSTGSHLIQSANVSVVDLEKNNSFFFVKANGRNRFLITGGARLDTNATFNLNDLTTTGGGVITALADDWYKISAIGTATGTGATNITLYMTNASGLVSYTGDGISGVYIFGSQLEQQASATSFIYDGTEGGTTTRLQDLSYIPLAVTTWDFTTGDFTLVFDVDLKDLSNNPFIYCKGLNNVDGWNIQIGSTGNIVVSSSQSGAIQSSSTTSGVIITDILTKIVVTRRGVNVNIYKNGSDITNTSATHIDPISASARNMYIGNYDTTTLPINGLIKSVQVYLSELTPGQVALL